MDSKHTPWVEFKDLESERGKMVEEEIRKPKLVNQVDYHVD